MGSLFGDRLSGRHTGHHDGGRQRQQEGWDLRDQAVTDGQQGIELAGFADWQVVLGDTDDQTADQVDQQNQQAGHGVTAHKFRSTVHRTEEV